MTSWSGTPRILGWLLTLGWAATLLVGALTGSHPSTLAQLEGELRAGQVEEVRVSGGLEPGATGYSTVELRWRSDWFEHHATAVEATPGEQRRLAEQQWGDSSDPGLRSTPVVDPGLAERLAETRPGARVIERGWPSSHGLLFDWQVSSWVALAAISLWFLTLALITQGPVPQRATRAAWVWLIVLAAPVGVPAYLVLGGPTGILRAPRVDARGMPPRGLTGGWAFLVGAVLAGALSGG